MAEVRTGDPAAAVLANARAKAVAVAEQLSERALAVTSASESVPQREVDEAAALAALIGIRHRVIRTREMDNPLYRANPSNRCYFCKTELYGDLTRIAVQRAAPIGGFTGWRPALPVTQWAVVKRLGGV